MSKNVVVSRAIHFPGPSIIREETARQKGRRNGIRETWLEAIAGRSKKKKKEKKRVGWAVDHRGNWKYFDGGKKPWQLNKIPRIIVLPFERRPAINSSLRPGCLDIHQFRSTCVSSFETLFFLLSFTFIFLLAFSPDHQSRILFLPAFIRVPSTDTQSGTDLRARGPRWYLYNRPRGRTYRACFIRFFI